MIKKLIITAFIFLFSLSLFSQNSGDSIVIKKGSLENKYLLNDKPLSLNQIENLLQTNTDAMIYVNKAKSTATVSYIFAGIGGALIGYPIGTALGGGKPNWILAGIGAALVAIDIPIVKSADSKLEKAVEIYNSGLTPKTDKQSYNIHFGLNQNGLALVINF
ncbi:conserved exported hypothetical protein [uncultured Paludibacter sp.]|uniref:Uncharacterized protein n=1 Tax=uncultured Paludibacter sp. TaxID=497635 RepID=A0A653AAQ0_9BACT|nr:conserved exported hypothetical protein [uncultured Paludibacter sp.]